jgi:hypothetical protein
MTAQDLLDKLKSFDIVRASRDSMEETKDAIADLNANQFKEGVLATGGPIKYVKGSHYPYSPPYERKKRKAGFPTDVVNLSFTNDDRFYKTEQIDISGEEIKFSSSIQLGEYLERMYTNQIWGPTDANKEKYIEQNYFPNLQEKITDKTGLQFKKR